MLDQKTFIHERINDIKSVTEDTSRSFSQLNSNQLNWKPSQKQWSVAQCLRHLIISNSAYFPAFEKIVKGEKKNSFWERISPFSGFWGKFLINMVKPENRRKARTFKVFKPSNYSSEENIISDFSRNQDDLADYLSKMENSDLLKTIITSPASRLINYSLKDCLLLLTLHEKRHILQAKEVMQSGNFPH